jgi:hypothetical protein
MRDKIKELYNNTRLNEEQLISSIEKYIISLLEAQKKICADAAYENNGVLLTDDVIKNAPYPAESDLIVLDKEKLKSLIGYSMTFRDRGVPYSELYKDIESKFNLTL